MHLMHFSSWTETKVSWWTYCIESLASSFTPPCMIICQCLELLQHHHQHQCWCTSNDISCMAVERSFVSHCTTFLSLHSWVLQPYMNASCRIKHTESQLLSSWKVLSTLQQKDISESIFSCHILNIHFLQNSGWRIIFQEKRFSQKP